MEAFPDLSTASCHGEGSGIPLSPMLPIEWLDPPDCTPLVYDFQGARVALPAYEKSFSSL